MESLNTIYEIKEDLNIPITMDIYKRLVSEMFKGC